VFLLAPNLSAAEVVLSMAEVAFGFPEKMLGSCALSDPESLGIEDGCMECKVRNSPGGYCGPYIGCVVECHLSFASQSVIEMVMVMS
jgi:hypothetical protein